MLNLLNADKEISLDMVYEQYKKIPEYRRTAFHRYRDVLKSLNYRIL